MPGLVPGIHGVPLERQSLLNLGVFPHPANGVLRSVASAPGPSAPRTAERTATRTCFSTSAVIPKKAISNEVQIEKPEDTNLGNCRAAL